jgi:hypothetical protein
MKNGAVIFTLLVACAAPIFAANVEGPRPLDAQLLQTKDHTVAIKVKLDDRLPDASVIYFVVEAINSDGLKVGRFRTRADVPTNATRREVSLDVPRHMETAKTVLVWAIGYRTHSSDKIMPVSFPPECGSFCLVGRNECNLFCAEQNSNVAMYRCYFDGTYCYYDCLCY